MKKYFTQPLKHLFDFKGRSSRQEFWIYELCLVALFVAALFGIMFLTMGVCTVAYSDVGAQQGCGWMGVFISILLCWIGFPLLSMGMGARRLHDWNQSGWWQLLLLVPYLGFLALCVLMSIPSTKGENRFGKQPSK